MARRALQGVREVRAMPMPAPGEDPVGNEMRYRAHVAEILADMTQRIERLEIDLADVDRRLKAGGL